MAWGKKAVGRSWKCLFSSIEWCRQGRLLEIAEYCCYDVKITRLLHEYGARHKQLFYRNRFGNKLSVPVSW